MKLAEILKRLRARFGDEKLSRVHMYDCSKSFKEGRKDVEFVRHKLKSFAPSSYLNLLTCKQHLSQNC